MKRIICCLFILAVLTAGPTSQNWTEVGVLITDVSPDESLLWVESVAPIVEGRPLLIEDRDDKVGGVHVVRHVYGPNVWLKSHLERGFLAGSKLYQ